ncbi:MAG TPA: ABC transporter ATP-binding protein [Candidatus Saccharimonadaceae bacterium]|nr:ABC transporter ATP-binding protein [Candidatus Saccharimonadaceae bacterium]
MHAIEATGLTVKKDKTEVLHSLDFAVKSGALTGLIGPSGSGKTTLMRSIVGVQKYAGSLTVLGENAGDKRLRPKIGYVTQNAAVYIDLTVRQNLQYFASVASAPRERVDKVIETVELREQSGHIAASLSGGQRARVSLAVALLGDPDLLVLDEPTVGLDPILRQKLWALFGRLAANGKTLLISSHVMDEADRCDELLLVRDGQLLWNDTREALLAKTKTTTVGDAFVTMIEGTK